MDNFQAEWILRVICSVVMGMLIGYERSSRSKEAGIRTHSVVALASCLLMLVSQYAFPDSSKFDAARIAAQVVSGISFLGAGIIFYNHGSIQGLTTAAGIWATAALGLIFGAGMYLLGILGGIMMFVIQVVSPRVFSRKPPRSSMTLVVHLTEKGRASVVNNCLLRIGYNHSENHIFSDHSGGWYVETEISSHRDADPSLIIRELCSCENVLDAEIR